jgi:hypothetical protein
MAALEQPFPSEGDPGLEPGRYQPAAPNPKAIYTAWLLFGIPVPAMLYLYLRRIIPPLSLWITCGFLLFVALAIVFSQWLERRTFIFLEGEGIRFESPLRKVSMSWGDIQELWCGSIRGGWRFIVSGPSALFRFQSLIVLRTDQGKEVRSGFAEGVRIAQLVQQRAGLRHLDRQDRIWIYRKQDQAKSGGEGVLR